MTHYLNLGACNPRWHGRPSNSNCAWARFCLATPSCGRLVTGGEVSAIAPVASMQAIDNSTTHAVAARVRDLLARADATI